MRILDEATIGKIKKDRSNGMTFNRIAKKYNVSKSTAYKTAVSISKCRNKDAKLAEKSRMEIKTIKESVHV